MFYQYLHRSWITRKPEVIESPVGKSARQWTKSGDSGKYQRKETGGGGSFHKRRLPTTTESLLSKTTHGHVTFQNRTCGPWRWSRDKARQNPDGAHSDQD